MKRCFYPVFLLSYENHKQKTVSRTFSSLSRHPNSSICQYKTSTIMCFVVLTVDFSNSPVPKLRWRKVDGLMPSKTGSSAEGPTLILPDLSFDDEGVYECEAFNSEGRDTYQGRISVQGVTLFASVNCCILTYNIQCFNNFTTCSIFTADPPSIYSVHSLNFHTVIICTSCLTACFNVN